MYGYSSCMTCKTAPCKHPQCPRDDIQAQGYCSAHYQRFQLGKDMNNPPVKPLIRKQRNKCSTGCGRWADAHGLCQTHLKRQNRGSDLSKPILVKAPRGSGHINKAGYKVIFVNGRNKLEHRHVMEQVIGRKLYKFENVHHKNGRRADNRPENLELWVKAQPAGQRPEDLAEFVARYYPEYVQAALRKAA